MQIQVCLEKERYSEIAKALDGEITTELAQNGQTQRLQQLYLNRGWCYQQLDLNRKALKDFNAAIKLGFRCPNAYVHRGQILRTLDKKQEALDVWTSTIADARIDDDLETMASLVALVKNPDGSKTKETAPAASKELRPNGSSAKINDVQQKKDVVESDVTVSQQVKDLVGGMQPDFAVSMAVEKINEGHLAEAEEMLEELVKTAPRNPGVRVARGTARALLRKLESKIMHLDQALLPKINLVEAIEDFSVAIEVCPMYAESWKRRGQARSALGKNEDALVDLEKALELSTDQQSKAECLTEQGMLYHKTKDYTYSTPPFAAKISFNASLYRNAVQVLEKSLGLNSNSAQTANMLGLCRISLGDIKEGLQAYERAIKIDQRFHDAYINKCQALKEVGRVKDAEDAYWEARRMEREFGRTKHLGVNRVMASMYQGMGQHHRAITLLDEAIESPTFKHKLECYYLRAACYHAMGYHAEAVADYNRCMEFERSLDKDDPEERRQMVVLAFYQKEMALYLRHQIDIPISQFCIDVELPPVFKELWCKKSPASRELIMKYTFQKEIRDIPRPPRPPTDEVTKIVRCADMLGRLLQYSHQGFLPNDRQQRAAGCAALELAQAILTDLAERKEGRSGWYIPNKGASGKKGEEGEHLFHWRDAMDIIVKWRQLSEPNDQVVWVDLLTPEEFASGFGSHTPMFSGQTKCVRYYMNFARALNKHKEVLSQTGKAYNSQNQEILIQTPEQRKQVKEAMTASAMYKIIKQDSWVIVPITSITNPETMMEGTRLTLVKVPDQRDGFEFSIRTPVTPDRWKQFEADLEHTWESFMQSLQSGDKAEIAKCILRYVFYWYNFMPLARGTAACGYTTILSLFWAAGMPITVSIPTDYQVDWEAILVPHPDIFTRALYKWLIPDDARPDEFKGQTLPGSVDSGALFPEPTSIPYVRDLLNTTRKRLEALNGVVSQRI